MSRRTPTIMEGQSQHPSRSSSRVNNNINPVDAQPIPPTEASTSSTTAPSSTAAKIGKKEKLSLSDKLAKHRSTKIKTRNNSTSTSLLFPVPETELLRDIIYILQGIDGHWMRFTSTSSSTSINDNNIIFPPSSTHYISPPTQDLLHRLSELGHLYLTIENALTRGKSRREIGMIEMSLHAALAEELVEYLRLIAVLEGQLNDAELEGNGREEGEGGLTLRRMLVWTEEVRLKMRMMAVLVPDGSDRQTGGPLLTFLHTYTSNGDPFIRTFSSRLLRILSVPFFSILSAWIYEGELRDPFSEFFVAVDPLLEGRDEGDMTLGLDGMGGGYENTTLGKVRGSEVWEGKFIFKKELLPAFLEEDFGRKIYSTGKSLNFMKHSCKDSEWVATRDRVDGISRTALRYSDIAGLEQSIALAYSTASERLFNIFFDKFRLLDHLKALKDYLMLGKGDFVEILMENLGPSLAKPANILYRHNLTATLEAAIKNSTASNDHADTLRRLDARMLEFKSGEIGWDVFTLEYKIDSPLDTILDERSMEMYLRMFKHLWQIRRVEFSLNEIWARLMTGARTFLRVPALKHLFHTTRLAVADLRFFITQLQAYSHSEVIECSWRVLEDFITTKAGGCDLDSLIAQHRLYLERLVSKALLMSGRKSANGEPSVSLLINVREIFTIVLRYREAVDTLCDYALSEAARQEGMRDLDRGITPILSPVDQSEKLVGIETRLTEYYTTFKVLATNIVTSLGGSQDLDMRFLSVRENYNDYYIKRKEKSTARQKKKTK